MNLQISVQEAETRLAELIERVREGEEIMIAQDGEPVARLAPVEPRSRQRVPGSAKGQIVMAPDFDDPLPDDILAEWEG